MHDLATAYHRAVNIWEGSSCIYVAVINFPIVRYSLSIIVYAIEL